MSQRKHEAVCDLSISFYRVLQSGSRTNLRTFKRLVYTGKLLIKMLTFTFVDGRLAEDENDERTTSQKNHTSRPRNAGTACSTRRMRSPR